MVMEDRYSLDLAESSVVEKSEFIGNLLNGVQCRIIDLEKLMPMANPSDSASVVAFAEGVGVIFVIFASVESEVAYECYACHFFSIVRKTHRSLMCHMEVRHCRIDDIDPSSRVCCC